MINGDVNEFVDGPYYGDERIFLYNGKKYFIQGYGVDGKPTLAFFKKLQFVFATDEYGAPRKK